MRGTRPDRTEYTAFLDAGTLSSALVGPASAYYSALRLVAFLMHVEHELSPLLSV